MYILLSEYICICTCICYIYIYIIYIYVYVAAKSGALSHCLAVPRSRLRVLRISIHHETNTSRQGAPLHVWRRTARYSYGICY